MKEKLNLLNDYLFMKFNRSGLIRNYLLRENFHCPTRNSISCIMPSDAGEFC
jgi:hypothetical protein